MSKEQIAESISNIELAKLKPFRDHPFSIRDDDAMQQTVESVRAYGVLVPAIARPLEDGSYELISGHRRKRACELAGLSTMPVIIRDIDRDSSFRFHRASSCSSHLFLFLKRRRQDRPATAFRLLV